MLTKPSVGWSSKLPISSIVCTKWLTIYIYPIYILINHILSIYCRILYNSPSFFKSWPCFHKNPIILLVTSRITMVIPQIHPFFVPHPPCFPASDQAKTAARTFLFSSESVNEGHPDKLCDQAPKTRAAVMPHWWGYHGKVMIKTGDTLGICSLW